MTQPDAKDPSGGMAEETEPERRIGVEAAGRGSQNQDHKTMAAAQRSIEEEQETERHDIVIRAGYEFFVASLLLLQIVNSTLLFVPLRSEQREIVIGFWLGISFFLILDVLHRRLRTSKAVRRIFTRYSWMTWVGSLPIPFITIVRLSGFLLTLRKLRRGEFTQIGEVMVSRHAQSTLLVVVFLAVIFFEFGSLMILVAEDGAPAANIVTAGDAVWWSVVTISTVGYGDTFPTTRWGRIIGFMLILSGVGLFTTITSFLARWFLRPRETVHEPLSSIDSSSNPQVQIGEIRSLLSELDSNQRQAVRDLTDRLDRLEQSIATDNES